MDILGLIGRQYMFLLLVVLFLGLGLGTWVIIKYIFTNKASKTDSKAIVGKNNVKMKEVTSNSNIKTFIGSININNSWIKLGALSLIGLIISFSVLGFISSSNTKMQNGVNVQGSMSINGNGMNINNIGSMNSQSMNSNNNTNIENQINQIQMQINQLQQQIQNTTNNNNGNSTSSSGSMGGM